METSNHDFTEALLMMATALNTLDRGGAPFEVTAYLDYAIHNLTDFVAPEEHVISQVRETSNANWLN